MFKSSSRDGHWILARAINAVMLYCTLEIGCRNVYVLASVPNKHEMKLKMSTCRGHSNYRGSKRECETTKYKSAKFHKRRQVGVVGGSNRPGRPGFAPVWNQKSMLTICHMIKTATAVRVTVMCLKSHRVAVNNMSCMSFWESLTINLFCCLGVRTSSSNTLQGFMQSVIMSKLHFNQNKKTDILQCMTHRKLQINFWDDFFFITDFMVATTRKHILCKLGVSHSTSPRITSQ